MKAVIIDETDPERRLLYRDVPDPVPDETDLLVAVKAAGTSRADLRRTGVHFAVSEGRPASLATGLEFAGEVIGMGKRVVGFSIGDRVMAMAGGANAERATVDYRVTLPVPRSFTWEQAAATPITFLTAHNAVMDAAELKRGETMLIQGGSSSVGIAAMQIARLRGAGTIFGTASSTEKLERMRELGCDIPINYRTQDVAAVVQKETGGRGVDIVIDLIGGPTAQVNINSTAIQGRIVCVGRIDDQATINLNEFSRRRIHMIGVTFRTRTMDEREKIVRRVRDELLPELEKGTVFPVIDRVFSMSEVEKALAHIKDHAQLGKVVLRV